MAYLAAFSPGLGPVPWAVNSEIYPLAVRGVATGESFGVRRGRGGGRSGGGRAALGAAGASGGGHGCPLTSQLCRPCSAGLAATANWVSNAAVAQTFLTLTALLGGSGAFFLYAGIACVGFAWTWAVLPETNGACRGACTRPLRQALAATSGAPVTLAEPEAGAQLASSATDAWCLCSGLELAPSIHMTAGACACFLLPRAPPWDLCCPSSCLSCHTDA